MSRIAVTLALVLFVGLGGVSLSGCKKNKNTSSSATTKAGDCAGCAKLMADGKGWCDGCDKGVVDGKAVECYGCYVQKTGGPDCAKCAKRE